MPSKFLGCSDVLVLGGSISTQADDQVMPAIERRPITVVVMADQLVLQLTRAYGHPAAQTRRMDDLAARSMRFDAVHRNSPHCEPCNFACTSGQLISRIAAYDIMPIDMLAEGLDLHGLDPSSRRASDGIEANCVALTWQGVHRARRVYLANIDDFDSKVGVVIQASADVSKLDRAIFIAKADHDNMLGERTKVAIEAPDVDAATAFAKGIANRWNRKRLRNDVIPTHGSRRVFCAAMNFGAGQLWECNPLRDASAECIRSRRSWAVAARHYRYAV